jgi:phosphoglycolate phosphatase
MKPRLLVFDLDGTLIDSRADLCNSVNATLEYLGKPGDPEGDIHDEEYVQGALTFFLDYYRVHKLDFTYVYDGVVEAIAAIREENPAVKMAVLTNKPVVPSREICAHFGLDRFFFQNYGGNSFHTKKPDPAGLLTLMAEASTLIGGTIALAETVMIGDSGVDVLTAKNCGAKSIGCTFGLAPQSLAAAGPDVLVDSAKEWTAAVRVLCG